MFILYLSLYYCIKIVNCYTVIIILLFFAIVDIAVAFTLIVMPYCHHHFDGHFVVSLLQSERERKKGYRGTEGQQSKQ